MTSTANGLSTFLIQNNNTPTPRHHKNRSTIAAHPVVEEKHVESSENRAWAHWRKLKQPKLIVAPMYDGSELPFRMLCRKYGAQAAYTPMLHSRTFAESNKFRKREFSTCQTYKGKMSVDVMDVYFRNAEDIYLCQFFIEV
ncbi:tRNA-dihydrouridine synthase, Aldolase-type TIM barrel [Artemisia annua]|uniref:tRNA-dihydrouridine synthase, Aldolase-type TIM barrel n=1 Tax=Artemisia annua TaxID=35608 RepID=A0A2U1LYT0_ARTAN|nr:tRNA-dihydrouridine synthase, Aldolase-type TIM barrel [Artemisia annua]